jgi:hypothetical protein
MMRRLASRGMTMNVLTTAQAARLLNVTPATIRVWQQRYAFPVSVPSLDGRRRFDADDVAALRDALESGRSIAHAVRFASRRMGKTRGLLGDGPLRAVGP